MKAIFRWGVGLLGLLLLGNLSHGYVLVTPVTRCPYPVAPSLYNTPSYYLMDAYGNWTGPYTYLVPPFKPFQGFLPGPTGAAIASGNLPHTLLLSKEGLAIGKMPMVGQVAKHGEAPPNPLPGTGMPPMPGPMGPMGPTGPGYGMMPPPGSSPYAMGYGPMPAPSMQVPYNAMPMPYGGMPAPMPMPQRGMPYGGMPYGGTPAPMPYGGMPYGGMLHGGMPYGGMPAPMPYPMPNVAPQTPRGPAIAWPGMAPNVYQAQNVAPPQGMIMPIPNFSPNMPSGPMMPPTPMMPPMPMMPTTPNMPSPPMMPGMNAGPMEAFPYFGPIQPFNQFQPVTPFYPMQGPMPPRMDMAPLQAPRMELAPPPQQKPGNAFPMHPFTRSPRDFFMWGESIEDEMRMRTRPFPVPR